MHRDINEIVERKKFDSVQVYSIYLVFNYASAIEIANRRNKSKSVWQDVYVIRTNICT